MSRALDASVGLALSDERRSWYVALGRVRLVSAIAFFSLAVFLGAWRGLPDWRPYVPVLSLYVLGAAGFAAAGRHAERLDWVAGLFDVTIVWASQSIALPVSPFPAGVAGFTLGILGLVVSLHAPTRKAVAVALVIAAAAQVDLMRRAGVGGGPMVAAVLILVFVAIVSSLWERRLRLLVARLMDARMEQTRMAALAESRSIISRMLEEKAEHEWLYRVAVEEAADGIALFDADTLDLVEANQAFAQLVAATTRPGTAFRAYFAGDDGTRSGWVSQALETDATARAEVKLAGPAGRPVETDATATAFRRDGRHLVCVVVHDLSARRRAQAVERDRSRVLQLVAVGEPFERVLEAVAELVEAQHPGHRCQALVAPLEQGVPASGVGGDVVLTRDLYVGSKLKGRLLLRGVPVGPAESATFDLAANLAQVSAEQSELARLLENRASHDALTGLPNRRLFEERLAQALENARGTSTLAAVMFFDLNRFKYINDTLGHSVGDQLLMQVAHRLQGCVRSYDTVARMGGDEFTLILWQVADVAAASRVGAKVLEQLAAPFLIDGRELFASASIGIAVFPDGESDVGELLRRADRAMYAAKARGPGHVQLFEPSLAAESLERLELEQDLRRALDHDELVLFYQPVFDREGDLSGVEALVRWRHPERGLVKPAMFIPLAEETGLIVPIGQWVLRTAIEGADVLRRAVGGPFRVAVNVSAAQFATTTFIDEVRRAHGRARAADVELEIELTESVLMRDTEGTIAKLESLRTEGVRVALDDFGTGYSSMSYLHRLPLDTLKIDASFTQGVDTAGRTRPLVEAMASLGRALDLEVVAEGIETESQHKAMRALGCTHFQGFLLSVPLSEEEFVASFGEVKVRAIG